MELFLICTLVAILEVARGVDVKCQLHERDHTICEITEPVTIERGEKVNIVSDVNLNSISGITFVEEGDSRSQISTVPKEIFEQFPNLETFEIYATIEILNRSDFEKAGKLQHLSIDNQLKRIPAGVLSAAKYLASLRLSNNQIAEIEDNAFNGLNWLLHLNLENNNLTIIKQYTFNGLENLQHLDFHSNQIESIEENALNLPSLRKLMVGFNKLTILSDHLFSATPSLNIFHAETNQIKHIGKSFSGLRNLGTLILNDNKLTDLDLVAFSQLPNLNYLFLNGIGLRSENISRIEIKKPSKSILSYLSLEHNELTNSGDWKKFAIFPQVQIIDVRHNKYSKIDLDNKTLRQQFPKLETIIVCFWGYVQKNRLKFLNFIRFGRNGYTFI